MWLSQPIYDVIKEIDKGETISSNLSDNEHIISLNQIVWLFLLIVFQKVKQTLQNILQDQEIEIFHVFI